MSFDNWLFVKPKQLEGFCKWCGNETKQHKVTKKKSTYCSAKCTAKYNNIFGKKNART